MRHTMPLIMLGLLTSVESYASVPGCGVANVTSVPGGISIGFHEKANAKLIFVTRVESERAGTKLLVTQGAFELNGVIKTDILLAGRQKVRIDTASETECLIEAVVGEGFTGVQYERRSTTKGKSVSSFGLVPARAN